MPMGARDEFSKPTKNAIALRASYRCSLCGGATVGPSDESPEATASIGEAAHIAAAAPGGRRYDASMSAEERSSIENAIWLCADHARLIDRDAATYTVNVLLKMKGEHENKCALALRDRSTTSARLGDFFTVGPDIVCVGDLVSVETSRWAFQIQHFLIGEITKLAQFIDRFQSPPTADHCVLSNSLGDGRMLTAAPSLTRSEGGFVVHCHVDHGFARINGTDLPTDLALNENNDIFNANGDIATVSGLEALPQKIRNCLSIPRGGMWYHPEFGTKIADYFNAFRSSPWLERLLKLEAIRQASITNWDRVLQRAYTPLLCVERVHDLQILNEEPIQGRLPIRLTLDVKGFGRWQHDVDIFLPRDSDSKRAAKRRWRPHRTSAGENRLLFNGLILKRNS
jgi:hypothetical protein